MDWAVRETGHVCDVLAQMPSRAMTVGNVDSNFKQRARHCEPTGPREARPDDRLREAIHLTVEKKEWFASSLPPSLVELRRTSRSRNDSLRQVSAFPRQESARVMPERLPSMRTEGAGNAGCAVHPRPRVQV
jgi:hypothetical protein